MEPFQMYWLNNELSKNFTKQNFINIWNETLPENFDFLVQNIVDYGLDGIKDDPFEVWNRYVQIVGDIIFVCSDYVFINEFSISNRTVHYYHFLPKPSNSGSPQWVKGAAHSEEVPFVFGIPLVLQQLFSLQEIELSKKIMNDWTNFAKTGLVVDK